MKFQIKSVLQRAACAVAVTLGAMVPAQSAVIVGTFDPAFSTNPLQFPGLGWSGAITFAVPDACLLLTSGSFADLACQGTTITSAFVDFYKTGLTPSAPFDRLIFDGKLTLSDLAASGGNLTAVQVRMTTNSPSQWVAPHVLTAPFIDPGYLNYLYGLDINASAATLTANSQTVLFTVDTTYGCKWDGDFARCPSDSSPPVTFTRQDPPPNGVPEPQSLALFAGALVAAAWASRRHRQG